jgi:hypothetical protein
MARTIAQSAYLPAAGPLFLNRWYFLMADGTVWSFSARDGAVWTQAPAVPGARVVTAISAEYNLGTGSGPTDTVYAACSDGTIWRALVTTPFVWTQVATLPP